LPIRPIGTGMMREFRIRTDQKPGDLESIADLHRSVYSEEYGFDSDFDEYVRETLKEFDRPHSDRERIWILEEEEIMGCIAVLERSREVAQIRWFLLRPDLRGYGIGKMIFKEAVSFIEGAGYSSAYLLTQDILEAASAVYRKFGFRLVEEKRERIWGRDMVTQRYERDFP
jgi:N-acetylglutamate synthase-like GNAT family acetyltransferase